MFEPTKFPEIPRNIARRGIIASFFPTTLLSHTIVKEELQKSVENNVLEKGIEDDSFVIDENSIFRKSQENLLLKSIEEDISTTIYKSHPSGLVPKKIMVRTKDGTVFQTTRWINPNTDSHEDLGSKNSKYTTAAYKNEDVQDYLQGVLDSDEKPVKKQRELIAHGIYDKNALDKLSGTTYKDSQYYLKEVGREDWKSFVENHNEDLPSTRDGLTPLSNPELQKKVLKSIEEIQSELGSDKAYEEQGRRKQQILDELAAEFGETVSIEDKWDSYETRLKRLFKRGTPKAVMAYGTGGVGKTYTLEKVAEELGLVEYDAERELIPNSPEYDYVKIGGKIGSREIQRLMYTHSKKTIIFDDCDSMWGDDGLINVLKNALDTSGTGKIQWAQKQPETSKGAGDEVPSSYTFQGRMVFITNLSKKELNKAGASPISESRASSIDLTMNSEQTLERLQGILKYVKVKDYQNEPLPATMEDKEVALETLRSISHNAQVQQLNTRTLGKLIVEAMEQREETGSYNKKKLKQFIYEELGLI